MTNSTIMDNQKHRKPTTSKLKRILQSKSNVSPLPPLDKDLGHTFDKASPFLQHSTNIHSLTSTTRSSFEVEQMSPTNTSHGNLFQPLSPPPPPRTSKQQKAKLTQSSSTSNSARSALACATKKSHSSITRTNTTVDTGATTPHGRRSSSLHYNNRPRWNQTSGSPSTLSPPPLPSLVIQTHTDRSIVSPKKSKGSVTTAPKTTTTKAATTIATTKEENKKGRRRHSCSSTTQDHQRHQRSRILQEAKKTPLGLSSTAKKTTKIPSPFNAVTPSCSILFSKASPAANAALAASMSPSPLAEHSRQQQPSYRHQCPPPVLSMEKSRSTPLRPLTKVKTYNVSPATTIKSPTPQRSTSSSVSSSNKRRSQRYEGTTWRTERDSERKRRQQELEDLISGRRGSTLKLSLTPKSTLLN